MVFGIWVVRERYFALDKNAHGVDLSNTQRHSAHR
jgi:hypothetical protein